MVAHHRFGQPFTGRTVVLTKGHSHGSAELIDLFATGNHLRTLVGASTAGEALGSVNLKLPRGYLLRMPAAHHVENCRRDSSNTTLSRQYEVQQFTECGCGVPVAGHFGHFSTGAALPGFNCFLTHHGF